LQPSIAPDELYAQLRRAAAPIVGGLLVAAVPRSVDTLQRWLGELPVDRQVVVYGVNGDKIARQVAVELRAVGIRAQFLEGGIEGWVRAGLPTHRAIAGFSRITRERPKIDRIAGPWLIRRFIGPGATFVPSAREPWLAAGTTL
jgi:3-mercaptopyruvate sulfurtransferase SseA